MNHFNNIIIGAGAAGMMCAATAGQQGKQVLLLDHAKNPGDKIRISGGGRCNFTNLYCGPKNFISDNEYFCISALKRFTQHDFIELVKKHNIAFHEKTLGQLFCDISSKQIIEMLLKECADGDVKIRLESQVSDVKKTDDGFELVVNGDKISCNNLVIATGGLSIPKMGATSFGYDIAKQFGLKIIAPKPALVPLNLEDSILQNTKLFSGLSVDAIVSCNDISFRENILFTHFGLSGPAILQISSYVKDGDEVTINFAPQVNILEKLKEAKQLKPKQELTTFLNDFLPKKLAIYLAKQSGFNENIANLSHQKITEIATLLNSWKFIPTGTQGYAKAEVTIGGIDTNEVSSKTFESKKVPGLFFIGEVLDVTGWLGGFNFQWAWACGKAAGDAV